MDDITKQVQQFLGDAVQPDRSCIEEPYSEKKKDWNDYSENMREKLIKSQIWKNAMGVKPSAKDLELAVKCFIEKKEKPKEASYEAKLKKIHENN